MKPPFSILSSHYPGNKTVSREALFQELGWQDLIQNPSYANTCAIRISVALVKSGITLRGGLVIQKGPHRGRRIEAGQARLAKMLAEPAYFGNSARRRRDRHRLQKGHGGLLEHSGIHERAWRAYRPDRRCPSHLWFRLLLDGIRNVVLAATVIGGIRILRHPHRSP